MQRRLAELQAQGRTPIQGMRVGINTGEAIVGNIGSDKRMDFTVIGDAVNVAARLQELAKELEADTLVSAATYRQVEGQFQLEPLDAGGPARPAGADADLSLSGLNSSSQAQNGREAAGCLEVIEQMLNWLSPAL